MARPASPCSTLRRLLAGLRRSRIAREGSGARTMLAVLGVNLALGALFGSLQVSVIAAAEEYRAAPWAGLLYSTMSAASLVSGLAFGSRRWSWPPQRVLRATASFLVIAAALLQAVDGLALLAAVLALVGACIAPLFVLSALLTERCVPATELTRALTWSASCSAVGIATAGGSPASSSKPAGQPPVSCSRWRRRPPGARCLLRTSTSRNGRHKRPVDRVARCRRSAAQFSQLTLPPKEFMSR